jgi:SpoVK/Ycf46/Vps4 family AAA+-type ATPase
LHALLGQALLQAGILDEAATELTTALELDPLQALPKLHLAEAQRRRGDLGAAQRIAEELLVDVGDSADLLILLARIQLAQGDLAEARESYRQAVSADPSATDAALQEALVEPDAEVPERDVMPTAEGARPPAPTLSAFAVERPAISFKDVGGMEALKEEIRLKLVYPMTNPDLYAAYGQRAGGGILMYGPPGCGKTYLARATAGEVDAAFLAIGLHDILDMWIGQSERNLHEVFELARANSPCVLFFDEVDALGASRSDMRTSAGRHVINQFLSELDGAAGDNEGILVLGATNAPWHLDSAFRRPGRFDEIIFVPPPDTPARVEILRALLDMRPASDVDVEQVAKRSAGMSGADLKGVVDRAAAGKLREAIRTGNPEPLRTEDVLTAVKGASPSTKDWFLTARNYVLYSNESGLYDPVRPYLPR